MNPSDSPEASTAQGAGLALTGRQRAVLTALAQDLPRKEIAKELGISVARLDEHVAALRNRLGAKTLVGVVLRAIHEGLLG